MIPPAPADFWERVIVRLAEMLFEREKPPKEGFRDSGPPHLRPLPKPGEPAE